MNTTKTLPALCQWVLDIRARTGMSQRKFAEETNTAATAIALAETGDRLPSVELVALITYKLLRDKPLDALEKIWSAATGREVKIPRPSNAWVHELEPYLVDATPETIELVIHLAKITVMSEKQRAAAPPNTKLPVG